MAKDSPSRLARALFVLLGLLLLGAAWLWPQLPKVDGSRIDAGQGLTGVLTDHYAYVWVLQTPHGAAIVDAGPDPRGRDLLKALAEMGLKPEQVHTVMLTHGHFDHWAAAHLFPNARVLAGPGDAELMSGAYHPKAPVTRLNSFRTRAPLPAKIETVTDGEELNVDGEKIRVIQLPGHTPGSVAYLWRDVLFTGDALVLSHRGLAPSPAITSEDDKQAHESLRRLLDVDFSRIADGHAGLTVDAKEKLRETLE